MLLIFNFTSGISIFLEILTSSLGLKVFAMVCKAFCTSACKRVTTALGVAAGATRPYHTEASKPGKPDSAMVGVSGKIAVRVGLSTASTRSLPLRTWGCTPNALTATKGTCPPITSVMAGEPPRYGTAGGEELRGALARALGVEERGDEADEDRGSDDDPINPGNMHGGARGLTCSPSPCPMWQPRSPR